MEAKWGRSYLSVATNEVESAGVTCRHHNSKMDGLLLNHGGLDKLLHIGRWAGTLVKGWRWTGEIIFIASREMTIRVMARRVVMVDWRWCDGRWAGGGR
jgi:hypothetical protein